MQERLEKKEEIWDKVSAILHRDLGSDTYERWIAKLALIRMSETQMEFATSDHLSFAWLETNYKQDISSAVVQVLGSPREIIFSLQGAPSLDYCGDESGAETKSAKRIGVRRARSGSSNLNPDYTFGNYVVGPNNQFAHASGVAVATSDKSPFNPLFIYGESGVGKTHLMHAIGNELVKRNAGSVVLYQTSEEFTNEYIEALRNKRLDTFRRKYRKVDVLLLDDVQFFSGKGSTQQEFFHTFNVLFDGCKHLVLSSDRPACEITELEPRLVSRFECGGTVEIYPPELETRIAILRQKRKQCKVHIDDEILEFLAHRIRKNVRRLEGALTRVAMFASISCTAPTMERVETLLRDVLREEASSQVSIDTIQRLVSKHFSITLEDMCSRRRPAAIAVPRQIAMYLSRKLTSASLQDIGEAFGGRDHGTVIHANKTVAAKMAADKELCSVVEKLEAELR